ncbi:unnamed protein product [Orchesella dallaii]|uniref:Uncharacterized protein n=1 Tax=Orchesella dallaii TaxID=48710 RepID=A0ABP1QJE3_9HEXA
MFVADTPVEVTAGDDTGIESDGPKQAAGAAQNMDTNASKKNSESKVASGRKMEKASGNDFFLCIGLLLVFMVFSAVGAIVIYFIGISGSRFLGTGRVDDVGVGVVNKVG